MRFRTEIILIPLTIICLAVLSQSIRVPMAFEDLFGFGFRGDLLPLRFLMCLGICVAAILIAVDLFREK